MSRIIALANQKGGVGKTTSAVNLAAALAASESKVLLIDLDPQSNATSALGIKKEAETDTIYAALVKFTTGESPYRLSPVVSSISNLEVIPGSIDSAALEQELAGDDSSHTLLRRLLSEAAIEGDSEGRSAIARYDFVILDTPPGIGILTINALSAAHEILVPVQAEYLALEGLTQVIETFERVRSNFNPGLERMGVLVTMFDHRLRLSKAVEQEIRSKLIFNDSISVLKTVIPRNVKLAEAPSFGMPIFLFDPASAGASAYIDLSREVTHHDQETGTRTRVGDVAAVGQEISAG